MKKTPFFGTFFAKKRPEGTNKGHFFFQIFFSDEYFYSLPWVPCVCVCVSLHIFGVKEERHSEIILKT